MYGLVSVVMKSQLFHGVTVVFLFASILGLIRESHILIPILVIVSQLVNKFLVAGA